MPSKRNAIGSPSRAIGKKRRGTSRTGGKREQHEKIAQKKDGACRRRTAMKTKEVGHVVAEVPEELLISHQLAKSGNDDILHYLDDFSFCRVEPNIKVGNTLKLFQEVCNKIGIPLASDKTTLPTTLLMFLGIEFDTQNLIMRLPNEKLVKLSQKIRDTLDSSKITLKDMQSLLWLLNFACKVVAPGRTFCRRLINSTIGEEVQKPSSRSRPVANQNSNTDLEHLSQVADYIVNQEYRLIHLTTNNISPISVQRLNHLRTPSDLSRKTVLATLEDRLIHLRKQFQPSENTVWLISEHKFSHVRTTFDPSKNIVSDILGHRLIDIIKPL
ncbi:Hypothetical predicted protein [Mytilus galloprovincialis]|uniref:Reverse transcriptase domain-containing protein n=1 Tax=Mytilus galloprovincialis TaxID=29158 RepID=A0A8B6FHT6_MYTGA|nr:Hypothetical predicted protein [Mytilus galloprovincialis]